MQLRVRRVGGLMARSSLNGLRVLPHLCISLQLS